MERGGASWGAPDKMSAKASESFRVTISPDRMSAVLWIAPGLSDQDIDPVFIEAVLDERGVARTEERRRGIERILTEYNSHNRAELECVVAQGVPPRHGVDAVVELLVLNAPDDANASGPSGGSVDHYSKLTYPIAAAGQAIARLIQAAIGSDGRDVTGIAIPARPAKSIHWKTDGSVKLTPDGTVVALQGGVREIVDGLPIINRTLQINGDVDFSTGHVRVPGDLCVRGGIKDCFKVHAAGDLEIHGLVESATLSAGRDASLTRGMAGREKGCLDAGRDLHAHYLEAVRSSVGRNADVDKEVTQSFLAVGRNFASPRCTVIGGSLHVGLGCEVDSLGSSGRVKTEIVIGRSEELTLRLRSALALVAKLDEQVKRDAQKLESLKTGGKMSPQQAEELTELEFNLAGLRARLGPSYTAIMGGAAKLAAMHGAYLSVHGTIFQGVQIRFGRRILEPKADVLGPLRITLDDCWEPVVKVGSAGVKHPANASFRVTIDDQFLDPASIERDLFSRKAA